MNEIDRWVKYMKEHPNKWKTVHTEFINAQYAKHKAFIKRLKKTPEGREKLKKIFNSK